MNSVELSLVVPLYNEEMGCQAFARTITQALAAQNINYELVLVNNGSKDETGARLRELQENNPRVKVVTVTINQGFGWGVINGFQAASGKYVGFMGGDEQVKADDVVRVYRKLIAENLDMCKVKRIVRFDGWYRQLISSVYNLVFPWFFAVASSDINGTPKIMTAAALRKLAPRSKDWFIDAEIMIKAQALHLKQGEEEIEFLPRQTGKSNVRLSTVWEFIKNCFYYKLRGLS